MIQFLLSHFPHSHFSTLFLQLHAPTVLSSSRFAMVSMPTLQFHLPRVPPLSSQALRQHRRRCYCPKAPPPHYPHPSPPQTHPIPAMIGQSPTKGAQGRRCWRGTTSRSAYDHHEMRTKMETCQKSFFLHLHQHRPHHCSRVVRKRRRRRSQESHPASPPAQSGYRRRPAHGHPLQKCLCPRPTCPGTPAGNTSHEGAGHWTTVSCRLAAMGDGSTT